MRTGVTTSKPLGDGWKYVFSYVDRVSTTNGYGLWAIDSRDYTLLHRGVEAIQWTGFNQKAVKMAGHWYKIEDKQSKDANNHKSIYGVSD